MAARRSMHIAPPAGLPAAPADPPASATPLAVPTLPAVTLGWIVDAGPADGPRVDFPGNLHGPVPARLLVALTIPALETAAAARQPVALVFERGDPALPLITGLVQAPATTEARIDGKRVVITGEEEVELRCGEASITLSKSGKLVIRGASVETRARGTNRIKGGSVQIN